MPDSHYRSLSIEDQSLLQRVEMRNARFAERVAGEDPLYPEPVRLRILFVADGRINYSDNAWGLSTVIESLVQPPPRPYLAIDLTLARRDPDSTDREMGEREAWPARRIKGFRFDNPEHFPAGGYDEVWLFGDLLSFYAGGRWLNAPSNEEIRAVCAFMNGGGGVFAAGDHGGLGSSLCGHIPRVRSMRTWFEGPGPLGEPAGPHMTNGDRLDTNQPKPGGGAGSGDQSDDIPQRLELRRHVRRRLGREDSAPHSLLCGRRGWIDVLPDHPHEGECLEPWETDRSRFGIGGAVECVEYPPAADGSGVAVLPEVIATSRVIPGNDNGGGKAPANARRFGAIAAYDGWRAGVGRVVTDATWHHFINLNLVGNPASGSMGFLASAEGRAHLDTIREYFRNIAIWTAPEAQWRRATGAGVWIGIWEHRVLEAVTRGTGVRMAEAEPDWLMTLGRHTRDELARLVGDRQLFDWAVVLLEKRLPAETVDLVRAWPRSGERVNAPVEPWLEPEPLVDLALGGAVAAMRERFPEAKGVAGDTAGPLLLELAELGAAEGLRRGIGSLRDAAERLGRIGDQCGR